LFVVKPDLKCEFSNVELKPRFEWTPRWMSIRRRDRGCRTTLKSIKYTYFGLNATVWVVLDFDVITLESGECVHRFRFIKYRRICNR
jgi:hypothetical protein